MTEKKKRFDEIDALRGLAIFLVVLGHSIIIYPINLHEQPFWLFVFDLVSSIHLPLFYLISGYCFSYKGNYPDYLKKKIRRLVIPFVVFNLVDLAARTILPGMVNRKVDIASFLANVFLYGGEYQFIYILFEIFLFYPLIDRLNRNRHGALLIELLSFILILYPIGISEMCISLICRYFFYFNSGVLIKRYVTDVFQNKEIDEKRMPLAALFLTLWIFLFVLGRKWDVPVLKTMTTVSGLLFAYMLTYFEVFVKIFKDFGRYSLQIYLVNGFALVLSRMIICRITDIPLIIVLFNMLIDFFISYLVIKYIALRFGVIRKLMGEN